MSAFFLCGFICAALCVVADTRREFFICLAAACAFLFFGMAIPASAAQFYIRGDIEHCRPGSQYCSKSGTLGELSLGVRQQVNKHVNVHAQIGHRSDPTDGMFKAGDRGHEYEGIGFEAVW